MNDAGDRPNSQDVKVFIGIRVKLWKCSVAVASVSDE